MDSGARARTSGFLFKLARQFWPETYALDNGADAPFDRIHESRIVCFGIGEQIVQIGERGRREDDLHLRLCLAKTAST